MTAWEDWRRERGVWLAAVVTLAVVAGWLQVVSLVLLWSVVADRYPEIATIVRAVVRAGLLVAQHGLPALIVGLVTLLTMTAVLASTMRSEGEEVRHG